jgi:alpha-galactosidase
MQNSIRATILSLFAVILLGSFTMKAQTNGLAPRPPMGWNSWNHFGRRVDDATVREQAEAMVASGMRDAGYVYINIDDTWEGGRDAKGYIHTNSKFPDMKALADFVHSKGLKIGIYSSPGPKTCAGYEGSYGHEQQDAETYAAWGIDYLKYDLCSFNDLMKKAPSKAAANQMMIDTYVKMGNALRSTGRPIVYSFCQYGRDDVWKWSARAGGNLWRTTDDINDTYTRMTTIGFEQLGLTRYAGPGHWNDPDMLEVGNGGMTFDEYKTHMSLWAILAAPLLAGNDLTNMSAETRELLLNKEVIAVDQDALGRQGDRVSAQGMVDIWARPLTGDAKAVGLFNRDNHAQSVTLEFISLGFTGNVKVRDLWQHKELGLMKGEYTVSVPAHGVIFLNVGK